MTGPLQGIKVLELAGIGPGPFCAMLLADMGAEVIRLDRASQVGSGAAYVRTDLLRRGRRSMAVDLQKPEGVDLVLRMCESADVIMEGFRPGVAERMGLGPEEVWKRNPGLVYGRMTGWGQEGPLSAAAGHDINYISITGALHAIGPTGGPPVPPLNLVGDFGGGGMLLAIGICAALVEKARSGKGQVVDAAMCDGASLLMAMFHGQFQAGGFSLERGTNTLDGYGAPYYGVYETKDGKYVSIGSLEPQFFALLVEKTGLEGVSQRETESHPAMKEQLKTIFASKTRDEWAAIMEGSDVCFSPVLDISETYDYPHNVARNAFVEVEGFRHPAPAPRFSRTESQLTLPPCRPGQHTSEILREWGVSEADAAALLDAKAVAQE